MSSGRTGDKVGGAMKYVKGRVRERWGQRTGNLDSEVGGQMDQVKGGLRNKKGHAKDLVK